jgi:hypothetical protein
MAGRTVHQRFKNEIWSSKSKIQDAVRTVVVSADLEGLLSAHEHADLAALLVLQELDITHAPLLPFAGLLGEAEQLGAAAKCRAKVKIRIA